MHLFTIRSPLYVKAFSLADEGLPTTSYVYITLILLTYLSLQTSHLVCSSRE
jgi:hypothetical protein